MNASGVSTGPSPLHQQIQQRLLDDEALDDAAINLVDAACTSDEALAEALTKLDASGTPSARGHLKVTQAPPPAVYLSKLQLAGFRGVGPERTLTFTPGPGLTLLLGRNGSGKSSFAEGLETLLTGDARRWAGRGKEWKDGWKNLHTDGGSFVEGTFAIEGSDPLVVRRVWSVGSGLEQSELRVRRGNDKLDGLDAVGWLDALTTFRPFLSYAELGALLSRPSELYDSLKAILGLEELATATKRLSAARKARDDRHEQAKDRCKALVATLTAITDDARGQRCLAAIKGRKWKLDEVEAVVLGDADEGHDQSIATLRSLAQLTAPTLDAVDAAVGELREAISAQATLAGTTAEQNAKLAALLEHAAQYCGVDATECPVCGGALGTAWSTSVQARLAEAREVATQARATSATTERCVQAVRALIRPVPPALTRAAEPGLSTSLLDAWNAWCAAPDDGAALCSHAESRVVDLNAALTPFVAEAQQKLQALESAWRPVALELAEWLNTAREVEREAAALRALEAAETWLKDADAELRDARFAPIADRAQSIWETLRQQSSVNLAKIKLEGKGTKRRVELNVSVDGRDGVAMSVMSQGETNALALSLFLPRMMLAESPFRFLIIDDPVQAMDAHKVDGLARVLHDVAKTRQVIVLTHDARLYEAMRRLQIPCTVLSVQRRGDSAVEVQPLLDPVEQHLKDALAIVNNQIEIGRALTSRTVPAFCRLAVEAACIETIRRRRLARGATHEEVEELIEQARTVHPLATLAIYDDPNRDSEVFSYLKKRIGPWAADTFSALKSGAHGTFTGDARDLVSNSRKIAETLRAMP